MTYTMTGQKKVGILVMSYGTPRNMEQIEAYYTHIRRGRPPSAEQLQDLRERYEAIVGGVFPLRENTDKQVAAFEETINRLYAQTEFVCYQGMKHAEPFIEDGVQQMVDDGIQEAVGVVLAPHYSTMSVGEYIKRAREQAETLGLSMQFVEDYHLHPKLIKALSTRVHHALQKFPDVQPEEIKVIFTAHSLPEKILELNDPYSDQLLATSEAIVAETGVAHWQFAWQSAGQTGMPWLGPDILEVLPQVKEEGYRNVVVCPIGFVSDHLEVLYDLDIEAKQEAKRLGMHLERTESLNTEPLYMETLSEAVWDKLNR